MLRPALLTTAFCAAVAFLTPGARADGPLADGNYVLSVAGQTGDQAVCILKVQTTDGKPTAAVVFSPPNSEVTVKDFQVTPREITFGVKQVQTVRDNAGKKRTFTSEQTFAGMVTKEPKQVLGNLGTDRASSRAKLLATDKEKLGENELVVNGPGADAMGKVLTLLNRPLLLRFQARQEEDAEKRILILLDAEDAQKEADAKGPPGLRDQVEKFPDTPGAVTAATLLLQSGAKYKLTLEEADRLVALLKRHFAAHGPRYDRVVSVRLADTLLGQRGLEAAALPLIEPIVRGLKDTDAASYQEDVLSTYKAALEATSAAIESRLTKLDASLDKEYLAKVPAFKLAPYAGRKASRSNRVAVLEMFTGAQCPPCIAADVAFDALAKTYRPTDLVLIQYHQHIPGPDPMTNPDTEARAKFYDSFSTPSAFFNGRPFSHYDKDPQHQGGGDMAAAEKKYEQYRKVIDALLEDSTPVTLAGKAERAGDKVTIGVTADGAEPAGDLKLRLLLIEDTIKYVGSNKLRFHHHVVRAMPGGAAGVAVMGKAFRHGATADLAAIRKEQVKYLADYAENERPFPPREFPSLDMKKLTVIALVQNDKTKEIVQAVQIEIEEKSAAGGQ